MKGRNTIILLVVLTAVVAYVSLSRTRATKPEDPLAEGERIFDLEKDDITALNIERDRTVFLFRKENDRWRIVKPLRDDADKNAVEGVTTMITGLRAKRKLKSTEEKPLKLKDLGLEKPAITVAFTTKDGKRTLHVGDEAPMSNMAYYAVDKKDVVYLAPSNLIIRLKNELEDFRRHEIFEFDPLNVNKIEVKRQSGSLVLTKKDDRWRMTAPLEDQGRGRTATDLLNKLRTMRVESFADDAPKDLKRYGLDNPSRSAGLTFEDGKSLSLLVGSRLRGQDTYYVKNAAKEYVYTLKAEIAEKLDQNTNDFRDDKVLRFTTGKLKELALRFPARSVVLTREKGIWKIAEPVQEEADDHAVQHLLKDLDKLVIKEYAADAPKDLARYGLDKPAVRVALTQEDETTAVVKVGKKDDKKDICYVMREGDSHVFAVFGHAHHMAEMSALYFKNKRVLKLDASNIDKMTVGTPEEKIVCMKDGDKWRITEPKGLRADNLSLRSLASAASKLGAKEFVEQDPGDLAKYGLDKPRSVTLEVRTDEGAETHEILLGAGKDGGRYTMLKGNPFLFVVSEHAAKNLTKDVVSLELTNFKTENVERLILESGGEMTVLARKAGNWMFHGRRGLRVDKNAVARILNTINKLTARSVLLYVGRDLKPLGLAPPQLRITVELTGESLTLDLGKSEKGDICAMIPGEKSVFLVEKKVMEEAGRSSRDFVAMKFTDFATGDVTGISIERGKERIAVEKKDKKWVLSVPEGERPNQIKFFRLLAELSRLAGKEVAELEAKDLRKYGLDPPAFSVTASLKGGGRQTVCVGRKTGDGFYTCRKGESCVFVAKAEDIEKIDKRLPDLVFPPPGKKAPVEKTSVEKVPKKPAPKKQPLLDKPKKKRRGRRERER